MHDHFKLKAIFQIQPINFILQTSGITPRLLEQFFTALDAVREAKPVAFMLL